MKSFTAALALALVLCLCGTASARPVESDTAAWQSAPVASLSPVVGDAHWRAPVASLSPVVGDAHWRAPAAAQSVATSPGAELPAPGSGGLSAFVIVLISAGGALVLATAALTTTRVVQHRAARL